MVFIPDCSLQWPASLLEATSSRCASYKLAAEGRCCNNQP